MIDFLKRQWFLPALVLVLIGGGLFAGRWGWLGHVKWLQDGIVFGVMFLMAFPLETRTIGRVIRRPRASLLASLLNLGLIPLMGWVASHALSGPFGTGMIVACAVPCTLASAAVWTRRAGGNDAVALLVTILTNLSCFFITPLWLVALTGSRVEIPLGPMIRQLGLLVVLPILLGQILRQYAPLGRWASGRKSWMSTLAQLGILSMVFIGMIRSTEMATGTDGAVTVPGESFLLMIALIMSIHLSALAIGHLVGWFVWLERPERIAVGFAGSQKTLMVGLHIAITYYHGGSALLPMLAYHIGQLLVDTVIADRLAARGRRLPDDRGAA